MNKTNTPYGYAASKDPESWRHADSHDEAIANARRDFGADQTVWILPGAYPAAGSFLPTAHSLIENMGNDAASNGMPDGFEWPDVSKEGHDELDALLQAWAEKHAVPTFWVEAGESIEIKPEFALAV